MTRPVRLKIILDGDLAGAIRWEADRRGVPPQALARDLLASSGAGILKAWREGHRQALSVAGTRPAARHVHSVEAVLRKSYGPAEVIGHAQPVGEERQAGDTAPRRSARQAESPGTPRLVRLSDRKPGVKRRLR